MDANELRTRIKEGSLGGVYIFGGEEEYLVRYYLKQLADAASGDSAFAVFNSLTFDGEDVDLGAIAEAVKSPPVMDEYKLIVWRHAPLSSMKDKELDLLESVMELTAEHSYAVLAISAAPDDIDFGTPKRPSKLITRFSKIANVLRFDRSTENQLYGWLKKHFDSEGVDVTLDTLRALVFRSGRSMEILVREVDKLSALAHARGLEVLTPKEVEEVSSSTPECETFALQNAITERNKAKAYDALLDMKFRRIDPTVVMATLSHTFAELLHVSKLLSEGKGSSDIETLLKMNPYRAKHAISAVKKYTPDRLSKIVSTLTRVDADSKYGGIMGYTAIELFVSQNI
ncbi:MAG: DNA polymerase III subunit delta [Clostridia bacterium]|nr:DNA polymerase III subunit delta [Clostridia bacterium]